MRGSIGRGLTRRMLEFALLLDELAAEIRVGTKCGYVKPEIHEERAALLREDAEAELRGLPHG